MSEAKISASLIFYGIEQKYFSCSDSYIAVSRDASRVRLRNSDGINRIDQRSSLLRAPLDQKQGRVGSFPQGAAVIQLGYACFWVRCAMRNLKIFSAPGGSAFRHRS